MSIKNTLAKIFSKQNATAGVFGLVGATDLIRGWALLADAPGRGWLASALGATAIAFGVLYGARVWKLK